MHYTAIHLSRSTSRNEFQAGDCQWDLRRFASVLWGTKSGRFGSDSRRPKAGQFVPIISRLCEPAQTIVPAVDDRPRHALQRLFHRRLGEADNDGLLHPCCEASTSTSQSCASMPRRMNELTLASTGASVTRRTIRRQKRSTSTRAWIFQRGPGASLVDYAAESSRLLSPQVNFGGPCFAASSRFPFSFVPRRSPICRHDPRSCPNNAGFKVSRFQSNAC